MRIIIRSIERRKVMNFRQVDKLLREDGWYCIGASKSSHYQYKHSSKPRQGNYTKACWRFAYENS